MDEEKTVRARVRRHAVAAACACRKRFMLPARPGRRDMGTLLAMLDALDRSSLAANACDTLPFVARLAAGGEGPGCRDSGSGTEYRGSRIERTSVLFDLTIRCWGRQRFRGAQFLVEQGVLDGEVYGHATRPFCDQVQGGHARIFAFLNSSWPLARHPALCARRVAPAVHGEPDPPDDPRPAHGRWWRSITTICVLITPPTAS